MMMSIGINSFTILVFDKHKYFLTSSLLEHYVTSYFFILIILVDLHMCDGIEYVNVKVNKRFLK